MVNIDEHRESKKGWSIKCPPETKSAFLAQEPKFWKTVKVNHHWLEGVNVTQFICFLVAFTTFWVKQCRSGMKMINIHKNLNLRLRTIQAIPWIRETLSKIFVSFNGKNRLTCRVRTSSAVIRTKKYKKLRFVQEISEAQEN